MKKNIWNKRIPTLLGLTLIIVGITVTTYLVKTGVIVVGHASPQETPQNVRVTNISDSSFTVSYKTQEPTVSSISYGTTTTFGNIGIDDLNQNKTTVSPFMIHHITVKNLQPATKYLFSITSGNSNYLNEDKPFEVTTGSPITGDEPAEKTLSGSIVSPQESSINEGIVYVKTDSSQSLSTQIHNGAYSLSLKLLRTENLQQYADVTDLVPIDILIVTPSSKSEAKIRAEGSDSVPTITLSHNYDFTTSATDSGNLSNESASDSSSLTFPGIQAKEIKGQPQITSPKKNEHLVDQKPIFRGITTPNVTVKITIESNPIIGQVKADSKGNWSFRPPINLTPGEHTITVETNDQFGVLRKITQSFTVFASGSQVSESATPSATPTKSVPTPTPTKIPTATPTLRPSVTIQPTPTNTPPSATPTPTLFQQPTQSQKPPPVSPTPPGSAAQIIMGGAAFVITSIGFLLFFVGSL